MIADTTVSIGQIEEAINHWRAKAPADNTATGNFAICKEVSALADIYALMIVGRMAEVPLAQLNEKQILALQEIAS